MTRRGTRIALMAAGLLAALPAAAHLTGVFAHFVNDINDPTASTRMLEQQLSSVGARIAALKPEVREARVAYDVEAQAAVARIRFYDVYAGSALGALWAGAQNPIDVIASTELLERRLEEDLEALAMLGTTYDRLQQKESSLQRYAELLAPFRDASRARAERLSDPPAGLVSPFAEPYIAYRIAEDWEQLRGSTFVLFFHWASRHILELGLENLLVGSEVPGGGLLLGEDVLNALVGGDGFPFMESARFYLRADHINFSAELVSPLDRYELLTVGQLERTGPAGFQYRIEAIFIDGMPIDPDDPDVQREVYQGRLLAIDLDAVLPADATTATFEQKNGAVEFRFR